MARIPPAARPLLLLSLLLVAAGNLPAVFGVFADLDDWTHLEAAVGLVRGDGQAWRQVLLGSQGVASARPAGHLLWAGNYLAFGFAPMGYFATNLLLHVALSAAVFGLVWRLSASPWASAVAAVTVGLSAASNQPVYYLSGRDDQLANLAFVGAFWLWQGGRDTLRGRLGAAGLLAIGAACKITIVALPAVLLIDDLLRDGRSALHPRRLLARYGALGVVLLALALVFGGVLGTANPSDLLTPEQRGGLLAGAPLGLFVQRVAQATLLPLFAKQGSFGVMPLELLRLVGLSFGALVLLRMRGHRRLAALGLGWMVVNLALPLPFVVMDSFRIQDSGRYLQLPMIGFALLAAAASARLASDRLSRWAGPCIVVGTAAGFFAVVTPSLGTNHADSRAFVRALESAAEGLPSGGRLLVGIKRMDQGLTSLASSSLLLEMAPTLPGKPFVFLEGGESLHRNTSTERSYGYGRYEVVDDRLRLAELDTAGADRLVVDGPDGAWSRVELAPGLLAGAGERGLPRWSFRGGDPQGWMWRAIPPRLLRRPPRPGARLDRIAPAKEGAGLQLFNDRYIAPGVLARTMRAGFGAPTHIESPPVAIEARRACRLSLSLVLPDRVEPSYAESDFLVPSRRFALLGFSAEGVPLDPLEHFLVVPLSEWAGPQTVSVRLDNAPTWLATGTVRRLALVPSNVRGPVDLHSVVFHPCEE